MPGSKCKKCGTLFKKWEYDQQEQGAGQVYMDRLQEIHELLLPEQQADSKWQKILQDAGYKQAKPKSAFKQWEDACKKLKQAESQAAWDEKRYLETLQASRRLHEKVLASAIARQEAQEEEEAAKKAYYAERGGPPPQPATELPVAPAAQPSMDIEGLVKLFSEHVKEQHGVDLEVDLLAAKLKGPPKEAETKDVAMAGEAPGGQEQDKREPRAEPRGRPENRNDPSGRGRSRTPHGEQAEEPPLTQGPSTQDDGLAELPVEGSQASTVGVEKVDLQSKEAVEKRDRKNLMDDIHKAIKEDRLKKGKQRG